MLNPSRYRIIAIGKVRKAWIKDGLNLYLKRLPGLTITELRDGEPQQETKAIHAALRENEALVALTEESETFSSIDFANRLERCGSQRIAFVIGGADGLAPEIKASAHWNLSLSRLTFPHEIARLLLAEQLYRAHTIRQGTPYHRKAIRADDKLP